VVESFWLAEGENGRAVDRDGKVAASVGGPLLGKILGRCARISDEEGTDVAECDRAVTGWKARCLGL